MSRGKKESTHTHCHKRASVGLTTTYFLHSSMHDKRHSRAPVESGRWGAGKARWVGVVNGGREWSVGKGGQRVVCREWRKWSVERGGQRENAR